jgi:hypothetical protein
MGSVFGPVRFLLPVMDMPQYSITISRYSLFVTETTNKKIYSLETKLKNILMQIISYNRYNNYTIGV